MTRFNQDIFLAAGLRTPFGRGGGALAGYDAISLSVPVVRAMAEQLTTQRPDLVLWGTVIPNLGWSNIAREIWLDAKQDPTVPSFSAVLGFVEIHRELMTAAARWMAALKLVSVLSARMAIRLNSLSLQKKFSMRWRHL